MTKKIEIRIDAMAHTYFGFREYFGTKNLYDGCEDATCEGSIEEVVAFLKGLRQKIDAKEESISWRGRNGFFYAGKKAIAAIDREINDVEKFS